MIQSLEILAQNRESLLLAEVAAWLHDMGKCTDVFVNGGDAQGFQFISKASKETAQLNPHKAVFGPNELVQFSFSPDRKPQREEEAKHYSALHYTLTKQILDQLDQPIDLFSTPYTIRELIYFGRPGFIGRTSRPLNKDGKPADYLGRCHGAAHIEKEEGGLGNAHVRPSSPFGFEGVPLKDLTNKLKALPYESLSNRNVFQKAVRVSFTTALGDTRRPENEVTLWDWSHIVAALYKAALAGALLKGNTPDPKDLRWRFLALRFNGSQVVDRSPNIQALLARRVWVSEGLNRVKKLLEETYPLGTEVYRDSNGSLFVVPDEPNLLDYTDSNGFKLSLLIQEELGFDGELVVMPELDSRSWWAQGPDRKGKDEIPPIASWLTQCKPANPDPGKVEKWWQSATNVEPCRISGVRPQGPSPEGIAQKLSDYWLQRMGERSKNWANEALNKTIWMDEVADINGRVALIAASLELQNWLMPDGLVKTLAVKRPENGETDAKTPSFARLRRIWETCERFWTASVEAQLDINTLVGTVGHRLIIEGDLLESDRSDGKKMNALKNYHAYEIQMKSGINMEVVWDAQRHRLISVTNLQYLAKRLGAKPEESNTSETASDWVKDWLQKECIQKGKGLPVYEPEVSNGKLQLAGNISVKSVEKERHNYLPAILILAEPKQFMVLVPACKALDVARHIKTEYEVQFSRVKNRLPLHLNLVFFNRKQPLYAALDAGRRMLACESPVDTTWVVDDVSEADASEVRRHSDGRLGNWVKKLQLRRKNGAQKSPDSKLPQLNDKLQTLVSYSTGAPNIEDVWYPYFFVKQASPKKSAGERSLYFKAPLPGSNVMAELVHVKEIEAGDEVFYAPSTFDFEFLDVTTRRFELSYDETGGMRLPRAHEPYTTRPFLLEDLDVIQALWSLAARDSNTCRTNAQLKQITELIETKRQDWQVSRPDDGVLQQFVEQTFRRSFGKKWNDIPEVQRERFVSWAASGRWSDIVELYMEILKERSSADRIQKEQAREGVL